MITPEDLLSHSQDLYNKKDKNEVDLRNITRLAYYSIYHKLKILSESIDIDDDLISNCGMHEKLIKILESSEQHKFYAEILRTNRINRVLADYKLDRKFYDSVSYKTLRAAEKFFEQLPS